jgi:HK97 gp10 family phage protein
MATSNRLPGIVAALDIAVHEALVASADMIANTAKTRVPVKTGKLRDAIHVQVDKATGEVYVVAGDKKVWYGHIVEHGSVNQPPKPFLVPALEENRETVINLVERAIQLVVR